MIRQTLRSLFRAPGLAIAAIATLALGVAFTTTMFSVVDAVLLKPLPFRDADRVVVVSDVNTKSGERDQVSAPNFQDLADATKTLQAPSLWITQPITIAGTGAAERVESLRVSPSIFTAFGVSPLIGRAFRDDDRAVVVLSHGHWQSRFGSDPAVIGKALRLEGVSHTIVGVLPPDFRFPDAEIALWQPLVLKDFEKKFRGKRMFQAVARVAPGATIEQANAEVRTIASTLAKQFPDNTDWLTDARPIEQSFVRNPRPLLLLFGAALLVLILACANVANLLLARAAATRSDMEIRAALGATRVNIIRHYFTEAAVLAIAGTAAGVLLAARMIDLVTAIRPPGLPTWNQLTLDWRALVAASVALVLVTLIAGVVPALNASRDVAGHAIRGRFGVAGERGGRLRRTLTAAQVALAVVLLVCAVLLVRSMLAVQDVDTGFDKRGRVAATLVLPDKLYNGQKEVALFTTFLDRMRSLPGVVAVGGVTALPLNRAGVDYAVEIYVDGFTPGQREPEADFRLTTPDYFRAMGIPLVAGRELQPTDDARAPRVAIVNETFARRYAAGREAVGLNVSLYCTRCDRFRIVGVVRDTRHKALDGPITPEIYLPYTQIPHGELTFVVRTSGDPMLIASAMRRELLRLDPDLALSNIATLDDIVARSIDDRRFNARLLAAFSICALLLAAVGLWGSLSFSLGQRRQEIAVRVALGASRTNVWRLVLTEAATPVLAGLAIGVCGAAVATVWLRAMMFGVTAGDPLTYVVVVATFGAIVLVVATAGFRRLATDDVSRLLADA
ncbi:MAG TPA: ABC transporter permease [Thermoanaerobaculia bacterium]|nr:ABC transporter permease [Thermoanaerobaculia bacterium]